MREYTINDCPVDKPTSICVHSYDEVAKLMKLLGDEYCFYIEDAGCDDIFVYLESRHVNGYGSPRYMWVSAEEEEYLLNVRRSDNLVRACNTVEENGMEVIDDENAVIQRRRNTSPKLN